MNGSVFFDPRALLQQALASQGCKHEWVNSDALKEQWIACRRCGVRAYVWQHGSAIELI